MITEVLSVSNSHSLSRAEKVLKNGGLVAFPTDTVYGVGVLAFNDNSIERLYDAKIRSKELPLPILIAGPEQLNLVSQNIPRISKILAEHFWPGPLTIIVERHPELSEDLSGTSTVGVRVPDHAFAQDLIRLVGPMAVSSANLSGQPSSRTSEEVLTDLDGKIELLIDGGSTAGQIPSTVVDCTAETPMILRKGPISLDQILSVLPKELL